VLEQQCPPALARAAHESGETGAAWQQMVALAPKVAIAEDRANGLGAVELCLIAEELGRAVAPGPFLATATQLAPLLQEAGASALAERLLRRVASGQLTGTVAVAEHDRWDLAAISSSARPLAGGYRLEGRKSAVFDGGSAEEIAVIARAEAGLGVFLVPRAAVKAQPRTSVDPTLPLADLVLDGVAVQADRVLVPPGPAAERAVTRAVEVAAVALALATVGTCRRIFERTLEYAKVRRQYERPIGSLPGAQAPPRGPVSGGRARHRARLLRGAHACRGRPAPRRGDGARQGRGGACQRLVVGEGSSCTAASASPGSTTSTSG
jgi:alkylation response protein AidB-like acyl-CoA dehydrogenase